jgi:alkylation response protein AidB-like acyl-CoA dehydrogenase
MNASIETRTPPRSAGAGSSELQARTEAGIELVARAEQLAQGFAERAAEHDRRATYPFDAILELKEGGFFAAPVPPEFGGLGVLSTRELYVVSSRLARGDASVTIGLNMHWAAVTNMSRRYIMAAASGNERRAAAFGGSLQAVVADGMIMAAAISEAAQDLTRPGTRAVRTDDGWLVNGRKIFCTMSPAATHLYAAVTFDSETGEELYGYAQFPAETPGVVIEYDWDALGMRASGSHGVTFDNVRLPASALRGGFPAGHLTIDWMERNLGVGGLHAAASLGIAESAHEHAVASARKRGGEPAPYSLMLAAQNQIDLSAMRAILSQAGDIVDAYHAAHMGGDDSLEEIGAAFGEVQGAKAFINEASARVVDRAMALTGGSGYMAANPISRAYRDVRAGAFMHPLGANRSYEFIGRMALGGPPEFR